MPKILLMRHAKSSWDNAFDADFDRPLNSRGQEAAAFMGRYLTQNSITPDCVFTSTAQRANETYKYASTAGEWQPQKLEFCDELYHAQPQTYLKYMALCKDSEVGLVLGHNPGIHAIVDQYSDTRIDKFPTAAIAVFDLVKDKFHLENILIPKKLKKA